MTNYDVVTQTKAGQPRWINISILTLSVDDHHHPSPIIVHLFRDAGQTKQNEQVVDQLLDLLRQREDGTASTILIASPEPQAKPSIEPLTDREHEILTLLAQGFSTTAMARSLSISTTTVRNHIQNILHKLQVHSRLEAVTYAFEHGLLDPP